MHLRVSRAVNAPASRGVAPCQSGVWARQPIPSAYDDSFDLSGFTSGANYCSGSPVPQRTYSLYLPKKSVVLLSLISGKAGGGSFAGIGYNGLLCGYNAYTDVSSFSTSSASCSVRLPAGSYIFNFCVASGSSYGNGSIVVVPNE